MRLLTTFRPPSCLITMTVMLGSMPMVETFCTVACGVWSGCRTEYVQWKVTRLSGKFPGNFQNISRTFLEHSGIFLESYRKFTKAEGKRRNSWKFLGNSQKSCRKLTRACIEMSGKFLEKYVGNSWKFVGNSQKTLGNS